MKQKSTFNNYVLDHEYARLAAEMINYLKNLPETESFDIEMDHPSAAKVSRICDKDGNESGALVQAWIVVPKPK